MGYNFLDFTKEHYPQVWEEFYRYNRRETPPAIGTKVTTLRNGFGGGVGEVRYVVEFNDHRYVALAHIPNGEATSLCEIETWWKDLKIISEPDTDE